MQQNFSPLDQALAIQIYIIYTILRFINWQITYSQNGVVGTYYCVRTPIAQDEAVALGLQAQQFSTDFWICPQPGINQGEPDFKFPLTDDEITWNGETYVVRKVPTDTYQALYRCSAVRTRAHHIGVNV